MTRYKTVIQFLLLVLLRSSTASNRGLSDELRFLHQEIGLLRDENQSQSKEIAMLKEIVGFQNNKTNPGHSESHDIKMIRELPTSYHKSSRKSILKRPARLLPFQVLFGERKNGTNEHIPRFYGPPTNCSDLTKLGYTLNGFYLVQATNTNTNKDAPDLKTETVFCAFKQPEGTYSSSVVEKRMKMVTLKPDASPNKQPAGVHFSVKRLLKNLVTTTTNATITFTDVVYNLGRGSLNEDLSIFTIPKNGIYKINFSLMLQSSSSTSTKQDDGSATIIYICVNTSYPCNYYIKVVDTLLLNRVLFTTLKLNRGDKIYTKIKPPFKGHFGLQNFATFSGSLLEEL